MKKIITLFFAAIMAANVCAAVFTAGEKVYFSDAAVDWWTDSDPATAYFFNSTTDNALAGVVAQNVSGNYWSITVPGSPGKTWDNVIFFRTNNASSPGTWYNQTNDLPAEVGNKCYYLENATESNGKQKGHWGDLLWFDPVATSPAVNVYYENRDDTFWPNPGPVANWAPEVPIPDIATHNNTYSAPYYFFTRNNTFFTKFFKLGGTIVATPINDADVYLKYELYVNKSGVREATPTGTGAIKLAYNSGYWKNIPDISSGTDILAAANVDKTVYSAHPYEVKCWYEIEYDGNVGQPYDNNESGFWFSFNTTPFPIDPSSILVSKDGATAVTAVHEQNLGEIGSLKLGGDATVNDYHTNMGILTSNESAVDVRLNYKISGYPGEYSIPMNFVSSSTSPDKGAWTLAPAEDVISPLSAGSYTINVWFTAKIENLTVFDSNDGVDYQMTFSKSLQTDAGRSICAVRNNGNVEISLDGTNVGDYITKVVINGVVVHTDSGEKLPAYSYPLATPTTTVEVYTTMYKLIKKFW